LFWLKIASSGEAPWPERGGRTSTTTARRREGQPGKTSSEKIDVTTKANKMHREDKQLTTFSVPVLGSSLDGGHE
jgi:hypothetical protein